jgi:hypothetical protein
MFAGAAKAAGQGLQTFLNILKPTARAAVAGSSKVLKGVGPVAKRSLKAISESIKPALRKGLKFSKNIGKQSVKVLKKKQRLAHRVFQKSRRFWRWGNRRLRQVKKRVGELETTKGADPKEIAVLEDERKMLTAEQGAIQHLQADEKAIETEFKKTRRHDLKPLLKKSNHVAKMINIENRKGAIDPDLLKRFSSYEKELLDKVKEETDFQQKVEEDEFKMMKLLIASLTREVRDLKEQAKMEGNKKETNRIKRRTKQDLAEIYMLQHALHLGEKEDLNEEILRKKALQMYAIMEWLKKVEMKERVILRV